MKTHIFLLAVALHILIVSFIFCSIEYINSTFFLIKYAHKPLKQQKNKTYNALKRVFFFVVRYHLSCYVNTGIDIEQVSLTQVCQQYFAKSFISCTIKKTRRLSCHNIFSRMKDL